MSFVKHYEKALAVILGFALLMTTTLLEAGDQSAGRSIDQRAIDLGGIKLTVNLDYQDVMYYRVDRLPYEVSPYFSLSSGNKDNEMSFGAKLVFDSYVFYFTQAF